ncbi:MAG: LPS-assembly protein LptD [Hyphomonadaceae bacterium]|nr:LPS-assembly protein LptD [Hyphomonadaceae bacterium]
MVRGEPDRSAERAPFLCGAALAAILIASSPAQAQTAQTEAAPPEPTAGPESAGPAEAAGQTVVLEADNVGARDDNRVVFAEGNVEARHEGRTLRADHVEYDLNAGTIHARGNVQLVDRDGTVRYADEVEVDENLGISVATDLQARLGGTGRLAARTVVRREDDKSELGRIIYTSCPICEDGSRPPTWALRARRAIQDPDRRQITYHGAVFEAAGLPVLYLPWFSHPDPSSGRTSGFLTPDLGRNRRLGANWGQPYYWAISPYQDLTAALQINEKVNPLGYLEYRKRFYSGYLGFQTSFTNEADFDGNGERFGEESFRGHIFGSGQFQIDDYWLWGFGVERTSDDLYLKRYSIEDIGDRRGPFLGDQTRLLSQLYVQGQDTHSFATVNFLSFQGLREFDDDAVLPLILPFGEIERVFTEPLLEGQVRLKASTAVLERSDSTDSARLTVGASWRTDKIVGPGLVVSPFAEGRIDGYRFASANTDDAETFTRSVGLAGAEVSWPLMRPGERVDLLVEPVIMAAVAAGENDARIVNEDSVAFDLNESNLFRPNAAPNYDLWEPGGRVAAGVRATARDREGRSASFMFGRRWRGEAEPLFDERSNLDGTASDYLAAAEVDLGPSFGAQVRTRIEEESFDINRLEATLRAALGRFSANARYYTIDQAASPDGPSSEIYASVGAQLIRGWELHYGVRRDLDSDINLSQDWRAIYRDDCTFLEFSYTRSETFDRRLGPDEGFQIRLGLTSLGMFGGGG